MTKPICPFMPTSNLIVEKPQITLDLVSKDVEKVVFQKMRKIFGSGRVQRLIFTFSVLSKVRVYENLKNIFQEVMGQQLASHQARYEESDTVENLLEITLNLSSKNVKNAFFETMTSHQNGSGITSLTFTFTTLSIDPIYEGVDFLTGSEGYAEIPPPLPSLTTHPARRGVSNPLYEPIIIYEEVDSLTESEGYTETPPRVPLETHPARRGANPLYDLVVKRKNPLGKIMSFFNKCFPKRSFPIAQARHTSYAFDSGFECGVSLNKALTTEKEHIYENTKERKLSEDSGYETIPSPKESIKSIFSDSGYEIPLQAEPVVYLEVLP